MVMPEANAPRADTVVDGATDGGDKGGGCGPVRNKFESFRAQSTDLPTIVDTGCKASGDDVPFLLLLGVHCVAVVAVETT